jgi:hypothetical protein
MLVAIVALVFAVAGTSVAAINSLSKKQKTQTRKIARTEIGKAAAGLSVAKAVHAGTADAVAAGAVGTSGLAHSIPAVHLTRDADQTINNNVDTALAFTAERYDTAGMHDNTNDTRITIPITGIYELTAQVNWENMGLAGRELSVRRNGNIPLAHARTDSAPTTQQVTTQARLQAGDYVEAIVFQESGVQHKVIVAPEQSPEFSVTWLAPGP